MLTQPVMTPAKEEDIHVSAPLAKPRSRYTELDALRGLAALTVVFYHFRLMWFGPAFFGWRHTAERIAQPFEAGHQAVFLFFALSGFVLSVPLLRGKSQHYFVYLLRRTLRIYGPYLFALGLALAGDAIWHGPHHHGEWADFTWLIPLDRGLILKHVLFIGNYDWGQYNTAFWSLVLEMRVSIIFPILFAAILWLRTRASILLAIFLCVSAEILSVRYPGWVLTLKTLPVIAVFIAGVLLVRNVDAVHAWYNKLSRLARVALGLVSLFLYDYYEPLSRHFGGRYGSASILITLGAIGIIILAINSPIAGRVLNSPPARFLGRISYSLYLVHGTVLFALTLGLKLPAVIQFPLYLAASFLLATAFCFYVEEPFMHLSRRVDKWFSRRLDQKQAHALTQ